MSELIPCISQLDLDYEFLAAIMRPLSVGIFGVFWGINIYLRKRRNYLGAKFFCSELNLNSVELFLFCSEVNFLISAPIIPKLPISPIFPHRKFRKDFGMTEYRYIVITKVCKNKSEYSEKTEYSDEMGKNVCENKFYLLSFTLTTSTTKIKVAYGGMFWLPRSP